jgi:hypothetical protein
MQWDQRGIKIDVIPNTDNPAHYMLAELEPEVAARLTKPYCECGYSYEISAVV